MWQLSHLLGGQVRTAGQSVIGWDMAAAFALAEALSIDARAVGEFLPVIEAEMAPAMNKLIRERGSGHGN